MIQDDGKPLQIGSGNNLPSTRTFTMRGLSEWIRIYFEVEVTTAESSQKVQRRDLTLLISFVTELEGSDDLRFWTPRLGAGFREYLCGCLAESGRRRWNDRSVNRILAHTKTFSKWVHKHCRFPLGDPMAKVKYSKAALLLDIEKAITAQERRRILDACDLLIEIGGRSRDRHRYRVGGRPKRKNRRSYRNRAMIYTLIETGMRPGAVTRVQIEDVKFEGRVIAVSEKGGYTHAYKISREGIQAIRDYVEKERKAGAETGPLFVGVGTSGISGRMLRKIWDHVCQLAGVEGKSPHSARHGMGCHIMEKTKNSAAVQRQLGHRNGLYSMQYHRITAAELEDVLDDR